MAASDTARATILDMTTATTPLRELLAEAFPDATELDVKDRTGGGDHFQVIVSSPRFAGLSLVEQHRLVYAALERPLADGTIHELRISTKGP
jgi:stress-induced morphogen